MNETTIERDLRLQSQEDQREMFRRIGQLEIWQAGHEATCAARYKALMTGQKALVAIALAAVGLQVPAALPHLLSLLGLMR
jgi:hypothetical protein